MLCGFQIHGRKTVKIPGGPFTTAQLLEQCVAQTDNAHFVQRVSFFQFLTEAPCPFPSANRYRENST